MASELAVQEADPLLQAITSLQKEFIMNRHINILLDFDRGIDRVREGLKKYFCMSHIGIARIETYMNHDAYPNKKNIQKLETTASCLLHRSMYFGFVQLSHVWFRLMKTIKPDDQVLRIFQAIKAQFQVLVQRLLPSVVLPAVEPINYLHEMVNLGMDDMWGEFKSDSSRNNLLCFCSGGKQKKRSRKRLLWSLEGAKLINEFTS